MIERRTPGGTVGAHLLDVADDVVGLRYSFRVNACAGIAGRKIVFFGVHTTTPGGGEATLEADVYSDWMEYADDLGCAGWPEKGEPHPNEPSLWCRNVDYDREGRVGLRAVTADARARFPRQNAGVDNTPNLTAISAIHQGSLLRRDVEVTWERQPLETNAAQEGWGHRFIDGKCTPTLPAGTYWPWRLTVAIDATSTHQLIFLVDQSRGSRVQYNPPGRGFSISTEYFFRPDVPANLAGEFQLFVWGAATLREGRGAWEPQPRWLYSFDATPEDPAVGYGFRSRTHEGRDVLEVSYSGSDDYARRGDVLTTV